MSALPMSPRSAATEQRYQDAKRNRTTTPLPEVPSKEEFKYFRIIHNDYEYDRDCIAESCDMLVIKREGVTKLSDFSRQEHAEYIRLRDGYIDMHYDFVRDNTMKTRSVPQLWHVHLLNQVKSREDIKE